MTFAPKNILVPVDVDAMADRPLAERLVDDAVALAKVYGSNLTLFFAALPVSAMPGPTEAFGGAAYRAMVDVAEARNSASSRALTELVERARAAGATARALMATRADSVPQVIVDVAVEEHCDLIAMTTHARRGLKRLLLGSVAERVAHLSPVPVLLLPPPR